jgi:serine/threonine protein kinase
MVTSAARCSGMRHLGDGSFGSVKTDETYAYKYADSGRDQISAEKYLLREAKALAYLKHKCIVQLMSVEENPHILILEKLAGMDLFYII